MGLIHHAVRQAATLSPTSFQPVLSKTGLTALMWVEVALCAVFVASRTWVQYGHSRKFHSNDFLIIFALACHFLSAVIYQLAIPTMYRLEEEKAGPTSASLPPDEYPRNVELYLRYHFSLLILLLTTLWSVKFSLLLFFWSLYDSIRIRARFFWWIICAMAASTFTVALFTQIFACGSPANLFRFGGCSTTKHIHLSNLAYWFAAGADIGLQVFILLLPFPLLWKLNLTSRHKILLAAIFLLLALPIVFVILKLVFVNPQRGDVDAIKFSLYDMLENSVAIITACIPALRLFITRPAIPPTRPAGPVHYYSNSELKRLRENATAISAHSHYNPFLPQQSHYRPQIQASRHPTGLAPLSSTVGRRHDAVKQPPAAITLAYSDSPNLNKPRRSNSNNSRRGGLPRLGNMNALVRRSSEQEEEREFGDFGASPPPPRHGVLVTTEYEVESYRHSLGSTVRSGR